MALDGLMALDVTLMTMTVVMGTVVRLLGRPKQKRAYKINAKTYGRHKNRLVKDDHQGVTKPLKRLPSNI